MKTGRNIAILLLYLWVMVGMTVATHFCAGEPVSATLLAGKEQSAACCCGDEPMEGCCSTSVTTMRVDDVHTSAAETPIAPLGISDQTPAIAGLLFSASPRVLPAEIVRPPGDSLPAHLLGCSLLI